MTNRIMELAKDMMRAYGGLTVIDLQKARNALQAEVTRVEAELAECIAEQLETRRKHREDYEALHDAVAERNELRAKLAALAKEKTT